MKIALLAVGCTLIATSFAFYKSNPTHLKNGALVQKKNKQSATDPYPTGVTLNGVPFYQADDMVGAFVDDNTSSHDRTSIWLRKDWVDNVSQLLDDENCDGFRVYFAKRTDNLNNTIVIVSTKDGGPNSNAESKHDHIDFYDHTPSYTALLASANAQLNEEWAGDMNSTRLYYDPDCSEDNCSTSVPNYISCEEAKASTANYLSFDAQQGINTTSEWFPKDVLTNIKKELNAALGSTPKVDADGIRIYFAKNIPGTSNVKHRNRHCFIIVTTKKIKIGGRELHQDYFHCYSDDGSIKGTNNNGEECPNNCNGVQLPHS